MKHLDLFSGIGGFALAARNVWREEYENVGHSEIEKDACIVYHYNFEDSQCLGDIQKISFSPQDSPAKTPPLQEIVRDSQEQKQDSSESWQELLERLSLSGLSLRMFPDSSLPTEAEISGKSLPRLSNSGIAWRGEYLTLNTREWLNREEGCGLSEVLETDVPPKYYLSKRAVSGMIRRSKKWGRGGYVFLQETEKDKTQRVKLLSLTQLELLTSQETSEQEAEILLQNPVSQSGETDSMQMKISLQQQSQQRGGQMNELHLQNKTLLPEPSQQRKTMELPLQEEAPSLPIPSTQDKEGSLEGYGKTLILRKLTPLEKERLMGYPEGWTEIMGSDAKRGKGLGNAIVPQVAEQIFKAIKEIDK